MATSIFSCAPTNATDAQFRDWGSKLSAAIQAVGFIKTADTGQINWTTVLKPAAVSTYQGYEIFRFNDALQATAPLYFKMEYGSSTGSASNPSARASYGKGSNGTGTISPSIFDYTFSIAYAASATPYNCYVSSGNGSMLGIAMWPSNAPATLLPSSAVVERSLDSVGVATDTSVNLVNTYHPTAATGLVNRNFNYASGAVQSGYDNKWHNLPPALTVGLARGTEAAMFPQTVTDGVGNWWQPRSMLAYMTADAPTLTPVSVPGYGTYLPLGAAINTGTLFAAQVSSLAMRWE